jgi:glycyl-tRNA synthetase
MAQDVFKKIVSHCKEYGFVFPQVKSMTAWGCIRLRTTGVELKNNIKNIGGQHDPAA